MAQVRDAMSRPPVFCPSDDGRMTPYVDSVTSTSILLELCLSTAGSVHYVVLTQGCSPPSPEQVQKGVDADDVPALHGAVELERPRQ